MLIPLQCEYYALEGLTELMNTLKMVRKKYNRYLDIEGVLFTMYSGRLNLTMQVVAQVKKYYGDKVFKAVIPARCACLRHRASACLSISMSRTAKAARLTWNWHGNF